MADLAAIRARYPRIAGFLADTSGTTAIEYGIIASLLSIVIVGSITLIGQDLLTNFYNKVLAAFP